MKNVYKRLFQFFLIAGCLFFAWQLFVLINSADSVIQRDAAIATLNGGDQEWIAQQSLKSAHEFWVFFYSSGLVLFVLGIVSYYAKSFVPKHCCQRSGEGDDNSPKQKKCCCGH